MRPLLLLFAMIPSSALAQTKDAPPAAADIAAQEQHLWTSFAEDDYKTVRGLFTEDYVQVSNSIQALDTTLVFLHHCTLTSYDLRDIQVRVLSSNSAMTAYHVVSSFACGDDKAGKSEARDFDNNSLTVWVRHPGTTRWLVQAHTETPVAKAH